MDVTIDSAHAAADIGVVDALVFRRIGMRRWAHLGGLGRGKGWAGIIDIDEDTDALAIRIPAKVGEIFRHDAPEPDRVIGPYYAAGSAIVRVSPDVAVVLGNPGGDLDLADDAALLRLAADVNGEIDEVEPSKRLADELELLTAVRELIAAPLDHGLRATKDFLTTVTMHALSCELGVARDGNGILTVRGENPLTDAQWQELLDIVDEVAPGPEWCAQDMTSPAAQRIADRLPTARAVLLTRTPAMGGGVLMMVHTATNPRGFSNQCRRILGALIETGMALAGTAALRDSLLIAADQAVAAARKDPLTGLGNRLAWDEAVGRAQELVEAGATYSVISVDVDGLKAVNDSQGHAVGDDLLRRCATLISAHCNHEDLAVRMGGDEFAVLVPHVIELDSVKFRIFADSVSTLYSSETTVAASVGVATASPGGSLFDAIREADAHMYENKRARRAARAERGRIGKP